MICQVSVASLLLSLTAGLGAASGWQALPRVPAGIGNFAGGTFENGLIVAGGITWKEDTKIWLDNIWRFDAKAQAWIEAGKLPHPVAYAAYGQTGEGIYVVGGGEGKGSMPECGLLNRKVQWRKIGEVSLPLVYSGSALAGGKLYVVAGASDAADFNTSTNRFYAVVLNTGRVENLGDFPGGRVTSPAAAALGGRIYVFGGATFNSNNSEAVNVDGVFAYSIAEARWARLQSFPVSVRGLASCALDERHVLLAGGYREEFSDEAFIYDTKTDTYSKTKPLPYRAMVSLIRAGDDLYCIGGEDRMKHRSDLFYRIRWKELLK
jgi:N-acetylneuraminic acid mutarotase